ncbi:MAG: hypothetical protein OXK74_17855 [Gemmatimonadota bacterium]|nr:hypothetical protein [Gemmatimonadota bacterium]
MLRMRFLLQLRGLRSMSRWAATWHRSRRFGLRPHALLAVAEPEKHLCPTLIPDLVERFR